MPHAVQIVKPLKATCDFKLYIFFLIIFEAEDSKSHPFAFLFAVWKGMDGPVRVALPWMVEPSMAKAR